MTNNTILKALAPANKYAKIFAKFENTQNFFAAIVQFFCYRLSKEP